MKKNKLTTIEGSLVIIVLSILSFLLFLNIRKIFPEYFFFDNVMIRHFIEGIIIEPGTSYSNTAEFYRILGFSYDSSYITEELFAWIIYVLTISLLYFKYKAIDFNFLNMTILVFYTFFFGAFLAQMSKDLIISCLLCTYLIFDRKERKSSVLFLGIIFVFAITIRTYWFLILFIMIILRMILKIGTSFFRKVLLFLFAIFLIQFAYYQITGEYLSGARFNVNVGRIDSKFANTIILNPFVNSNIFTDFANFIYGLLNIFIPINGLGSKNEIVYYVWMFICVYSIIKFIRQSDISVDKKNTIFLLFLFSFIVTQAFFEPDSGSMLRHQVPLIPIVFLVISSKQV